MKCALVCALAVPLFAQDVQFHARSPLVLVPVTVTDRKGDTVSGLEPSDFGVFDRGRAQNPSVDFIDTGVAPIALAIVVQSSGISAAALEKIRKVGSMVQPMVTGERGCAALVSFDEQVNWLQECTKDPHLQTAAFQKLTPLLRPGEDHNARMLDAVSSAVDHLAKLTESRRVLLLISESKDRGSETDLAAATIAAQRAEVTVYAITYSAFKTAFTSKLPVSAPRRPLKPKMPTDEGPNAVNGMPPGRMNPFPKQLPPEQQVDALGAVGELARLGKANAADVLTKRTGGEVLSFTRQRELEDALTKLGADLHTQYVLSFVPDLSAPGYHPIEVVVTTGGQYRVRARPGYWVLDEQ